MENNFNNRLNGIIQLQKMANIIITTVDYRNNTFCENIGPLQSDDIVEKSTKIMMFKVANKHVFMFL